MSGTSPLLAIATAAASGSRAHTIGSAPVMLGALAGLAALAGSVLLRPERVRRWRASYYSRREHHARQRGFRTADELTLRERLSARWTAAEEQRSGLPAMTKVPPATVLFWITKVLTTGMGETTSDDLVHRFNPAVGVALAGICLAGALALQLLARRYVPWIYWLAVVMVAVFGTMAADFLHVELGVAYVVSTTFFAVALVVVFATWYASEQTLSIHSITTIRREAFYWATVLTTFALGTAAGDMTAVTLHLGYFLSGVMFATLIAIPALAYWRFRLNEVVAFWAAYVLTRPLGASFADWIAVSHKRGGLAFGDQIVSIFLLVVIFVLVACLSVAAE